MLSPLALSQARAEAPTTRVLKNGLRVVVVHDPSAESVVAFTRVGAGNADEKIPGIAHFFEHMEHRGTRTHPSGALFEAELEKLQIERNAFTDFDSTGYYMKTKPENLGGMLELQAEMLREPLILEADVRSEQGAVQMETRRNLANPDITLFQIGLAMRAKPGTRMSQIMSGTVEDTAGTDAIEMREFFETYYSANNMVLVVAGNLPDKEAVLETIEKHYGSLSQRGVPTPASVSAQLELPTPEKPARLVEIDTTARNVRKLSIEFPVARELGSDLLLSFLGDFLSRDGKDTPFNELLTSRLVVKPAHNGAVAQIGVQPLRDVLLFRIVFNLTAEGEKRYGEIVEKVSSVLGAIATKGFPAYAYVERLRSNSVPHVGNGTSDPLPMAMGIAEGVAQFGLEKLGAQMEILSGLRPEDVQKLASTLSPERAWIQLMSPSVKGEQTLAGVPVRMSDAASLQGRAQEAFTKAQGPVEIGPNRQAYTDQPYDIQKPGVAIGIYPDELTPFAEGTFEIDFPVPTRIEDKVAFSLLLRALELDPVNARLTDDLRRAGVDIKLGYNPVTMSVVIEGRGLSARAIRAINSKLELLRSYVPTAEALEMAKTEFIHELRNYRAEDAGVLAVIEGKRRLQGGAELSIRDQIAVVQKIDVKAVKRIVEKNQGEWGVKAVLMGNWGDLPALTTIPLITPPKAGAIRLPDPQPNPNVAKTPALVGTRTELAHQGIARFYPVRIEPDELMHWRVFAQILTKRLMATVRSELKLAYSVGARFELLSNGGGALVLVGDTSERLMKMALGFTVTLTEILHHEKAAITESEFQAALAEVREAVLAQSRISSRSVFDRSFLGYKPEELLAQLEAMNPDQIIAVVKPVLEDATERGKRVDSLAVANGDPVCETLFKVPSKK